MFQRFERVTWLVCLAACAAPEDASRPAAEAPATAPQPVATPEQSAPADEFVALLEGLGVRLKADQGTVEVHGRVNQRSGGIEVFACAPAGKLHESVVVLDCVPSGLHAGLLALGLEPGVPVVYGARDAFRPPGGPPVEIEVLWRDAQGREQRARAEDWIWDEVRGAAMERAGWIFAGSIEQPLPDRPGAVLFAADAVKSLAVTYHDATSLLENPHASGRNDAAYSANERAVPEVGTPIVAVFRPAQGGAR